MPVYTHYYIHCEHMPVYIVCTFSVNTVKCEHIVYIMYSVNCAHTHTHTHLLKVIAEANVWSYYPSRVFTCTCKNIFLSPF